MADAEISMLRQDDGGEYTAARFDRHTGEYICPNALRLRKGIERTRNVPQIEHDSEKRTEEKQRSYVSESYRAQLPGLEGIQACGEILPSVGPPAPFEALSQISARKALCRTATCRLDQTPTRLPRRARLLSQSHLARHRPDENRDPRPFQLNITLIRTKTCRKKMRQYYVITP